MSFGFRPAKQKSRRFGILVGRTFLAFSNRVQISKSAQPSGCAEKTGAFSPPRFWAPAFKSTPIPRDDRAAHLLSANFLMESKGQPLLFQSMQRRCRVEERRVNSKGFVRIFPLNNQEDAATPACELMYTERDLRNGAFLFIFIAPYKAVWGS